jgi:hypothetical protein
MRIRITRAAGAVAVALSAALLVNTGAGATAIASAPEIARAQFTTAVRDRAPSDSLTTIAAGTTEVSFFTEVKGMNGETITHRWQRDGKVAFEKTFTVGADRWRVWSSKNVAGAKGEWSVDIVDKSGTSLGTYKISAATP